MDPPLSQLPPKDFGEKYFFSDPFFDW